MERYPLRFGMAAYAWRSDDEAFSGITDYRIDIDREYPVKVSVKSEGGDPWATSREVGTAKAGGAPGAFWVEFETADRTPRFYSAWKVEKGGVAQLTDILLATGSVHCALTAPGRQLESPRFGTGQGGVAKHTPGTVPPRRS